MKKKQNFHPLRNLASDVPAGVVVFLVALPLCLGIAQGSGASAFSGLISGIVGGLVITLISGSALSVSGPAAGLTAIVLSAIQTLGNFEHFIAAVVIAGVLQIIMGIARAGVFGNYIPSSVIKGMLAAIGLMLILKQIPHALGYDNDFEGDESFVQPDGENTFSEIYHAVLNMHSGALIIALSCIALLLFWERKFIQKNRFLRLIPGPLLAVVVGIGLNRVFGSSAPELVSSGKQLVDLPVLNGIGGFFEELRFPDFQGALVRSEVWVIAVTLAIVASIESLLSLEATDRIDPYKRVSPPNRELIAQGTGNMVSGLIGGLPMTAVIVRSSANLAGGAKTKASSFIHGLLLLVCLLSIPALLNQIPKSCLAAVLIMVGYKLAKVSLFKSQFEKGWNQFLPFVITIVAILWTDLLIGILIGLGAGLLFVLRSNFSAAATLSSSGNNYLLKFHKDVTFLNKPLMRKMLHSIPNASFVLVDGSQAQFVDQDILEEIEEFKHKAPDRHITVETRNLTVQ